MSQSGPHGRTTFDHIPSGAALYERLVAGLRAKTRRSDLKMARSMARNRKAPEADVPWRTPGGGVLSAQTGTAAEAVVISTDGAVSGRRAACAAVVSVDGRVVAESSRRLFRVHGYVLAAEVMGVALGIRLAEPILSDREAVVLEVDNPSIPGVIDSSYRPPGLRRIPTGALEAVREFCCKHPASFHVLRRNATPGLRRADRLASKRLWGYRQARMRAR